jgi:hypothetical protein
MKPKRCFSQVSIGEDGLDEKGDLMLRCELEAWHLGPCQKSSKLGVICWAGFVEVHGEGEDPDWRGAPGWVRGGTTPS